MMNPQHFVEETITTSPWCMDTLRVVRELNLPDWAIGAGFVRNMVWDRLHGVDQPTALTDVDVLYYEPENVNRQRETCIEKALHKLLPDRPWSVRNQARMHVRNNDIEYRNTAHAISHWLETPTCVAVRLEDNDTLHIIAPFGLDDLIGLRVRPTLMGQKKHDQYLARIQAKNWSHIWPQVTIER